MSLFILFNTVLYDGIGDFFHFEEIMDALLKNEKFNGVKFIVFINFHEEGTEKNFTRIETKLNTGLRQQSERVQVHFGKLGFHEKLRTSRKLQHILASAMRGVIISNDGTTDGQSLVKCYVDSCPNLLKIPFTYVVEHEITSPAYPKEGRGVSYDHRVLGLYDGLSKYTFLEYTSQEDMKENHFYLQRNQSGQIIYFLKAADGAKIEGHPDLNSHEGDLNQLADYIKKQILINANGSGHIEYDIPVQQVCGIKLKDIPRIEPLKAWQIMQLQDPVFANQLLINTDSSDFDQFITNNIIMPVYLNKERHLTRLLCFLSNNILAKKTDDSPKNVVIYLSGCHFPSKENLLNHLMDLTPKFSYELIQNEQLNNEGNLITIKCDQYTIKIFSGFYLNDAAYDAVYHLSHVAVASGDNTLERCISMNVLPFYWSSNHSSNKWKTVLALQEITQRPELPLSDEARLYFKHFFCCTQRLATCEGSFQYFDLIDFPKIIEEWPIVASYLQKNKNFYAHLERIMFSRLSTEQVHRCEKQQSVDKMEDRMLLSSDELLVDAGSSGIPVVCLHFENTPNHPWGSRKASMPFEGFQNVDKPREFRKNLDALHVRHDNVEKHVVAEIESVNNSSFEAPRPVTCSQDPEILLNPQSIESNSSLHGGCWQAICDFFNRIYNAIIRILQQRVSNSNYSPQLFQPVRDAQNVISAQKTAEIRSTQNLVTTCSIECK